MQVYLTTFQLDEHVGTPVFCPSDFDATIDFGLAHGEVADIISPSAASLHDQGKSPPAHPHLLTS
jgi:hypothetical protein